MPAMRGGVETRSTPALSIAGREDTARSDTNIGRVWVEDPVCKMCAAFDKAYGTRGKGYGKTNKSTKLVCDACCSEGIHAMDLPEYICATCADVFGCKTLQRKGHESVADRFRASLARRILSCPMHRLSCCWQSMYSCSLRAHTCQTSGVAPRSHVSIYASMLPVLVSLHDTHVQPLSCVFRGTMVYLIPWGARR